MRPRLGSVNLALLSLYFFPLWGREAFRALISPYHGLEDRTHAVATVYISRLFYFGVQGLALTAHVIAGMKLVIGVSFAVYLIEFARAWTVGRNTDRETIDCVLILAVVGIVIHAVPALAFGDGAMIRLYATQTLLIAGAIIVIAVERQIAPEREPAAPVVVPTQRHEAVRRLLPVGILAEGPPPAQTAAALARIPETRLRSGEGRRY
jgi:hypothetical protein